MGRSSRLIFFLGIALLPCAAQAQFYGFPSEVGVIDDGFGTLPPLPQQPPQLPPGEGAPPFLPPFAAPPPPPPCPLVIRIGPGLRHTASARVVYGRPACS